MEILDIFQKLDAPLRLGLSGLALTTLVWLPSMLIATFLRAKVTGTRRSEIVASVFAILLAVSLAFVGRAMTTRTEPEPSAQTPVASGGTGTCASIRPGMPIQEVRTLLGTPSIDQSSEDARGPGAHVMAFDDSRCVVHFMHGRVDQVE